MNWSKANESHGQGDEVLPVNIFSFQCFSLSYVPSTDFYSVEKLVVV